MDDGKQKADSQEAFKQLAREQLPVLYGMARRFGGEQAEDMVQEALTRAFRSWSTLKDRQAGPKWIQMILVNSYRDRLRKDSRSVPEVPLDERLAEFSLYRTLAEEDPFPYSDTLHVDFLRAFGKEDVHAVLMRMPPIYRTPLVLRYMNSLSTKEIARNLDLPLGTVLARLHRGRKLFEKLMWEYAQENDLLLQEPVR